MGPLPIQKSEKNESYREINRFSDWFGVFFLFVVGGFLGFFWVFLFPLDGRERTALCP